MHPLEQFLQTGEPLHVAADGQMSFASSKAAKVLLPGSFNPIHVGHWRLAEIAASIVGESAAFELSVDNVDKPNLTQDEIRQRLTQFDGQAAVWLTRAARFAQKAELFPGARGCATRLASCRRNIMMMSRKCSSCWSHQSLAAICCMPRGRRERYEDDLAVPARSRRF